MTFTLEMWQDGEKTSSSTQELPGDVTDARVVAEINGRKFTVKTSFTRTVAPPPAATKETDEP
jgi:hypothetical protein